MIIDHGTMLWCRWLVIGGTVSGWIPSCGNDRRLCCDKVIKEDGLMLHSFEYIAIASCMYVYVWGVYLHDVYLYILHTAHEMKLWHNLVQVRGIVCGECYLYGLVTLN